MLPPGEFINTMSLTLSLSENAAARLRTIMEVRGLASLEAAAEFAFKESERKALIIKKLYADPLPDEAWADAFYPEYDLEKIRAMDLPPTLQDNAA